MISLDAIRAGLADGEFFLEYLPTVSLADGRCVGAEALSRWRRASGVVQPGEFINLIEGTPVSGTLTYWVFAEALRAAGIPMAQGYYFSRPISAEKLKVYYSRASG